MYEQHLCNWKTFLHKLLVSELIVDGWLLGNCLCFFDVIAMAEVLCWVLFYKLMSSSQLLEPQHLPRACSLPELLTFTATVIWKTSHHSAWGRWEMKRLPCGRFDYSKLTVAFFSQANVSSQLGECSKIDVFHGWDTLLILSYPLM